MIESLYNDRTLFPDDTSIQQGVDEKIIFPSQKSEAKILLRYLNEEVFIGPITDKIYQTNSKKEAN